MTDLNRAFAFTKTAQSDGGGGRYVCRECKTLAKTTIGLSIQTYCVTKADEPLSMDQCADMREHIEYHALQGRFPRFRDFDMEQRRMYGGDTLCYRCRDCDSFEQRLLVSALDHCHLGFSKLKQALTAHSRSCHQPPRRQQQQQQSEKELRVHFVPDEWTPSSYICHECLQSQFCRQSPCADEECLLEYHPCECWKENVAVCLHCLEVLHSKSRHDFQQCKCPNAAFVDGGPEFNEQRHGAKQFNKLVMCSDLKSGNAIRQMLLHSTEKKEEGK